MSPLSRSGCALHGAEEEVQLEKRWLEFRVPSGKCAEGVGAAQEVLGCERETRRELSRGLSPCQRAAVGPLVAGLPACYTSSAPGQAQHPLPSGTRIRPGGGLTARNGLKTPVYQATCTTLGCGTLATWLKSLNST